MARNSQPSATDSRPRHHHVPRHEPTLIATAGSRTTAGSRCGTFNRAELTADVLVRDVSPAPLTGSIAGTTGSTRTTPRRAAWRSGRLLERPVDGAAADAQRPGDLGHGDVLGLVPGPGQPGLLRGEFGGPAPGGRGPARRRGPPPPARRSAPARTRRARRRCGRPDGRCWWWCRSPRCARAAGPPLPVTRWKPPSAAVTQPGTPACSSTGDSPVIGTGHGGCAPRPWAARSSQRPSQRLPRCHARSRSAAQHPEHDRRAGCPLDARANGWPSGPDDALGRHCR